MSSLLLHPRLVDCRRLFLRNYEVWINIGVHDFEKTGEQRVVINVELFVPLTLSTPTADQLDEVVDYDFIRRSIGERVARGHIHLQLRHAQLLQQNQNSQPQRHPLPQPGHEAINQLEHRHPPRHEWQSC